MKVLYHIDINSFYVEIVRIKYQCDEYIKAHIRYYYKTSMTMFAEEKNVKLYRETMKHWKKEFK